MSLQTLHDNHILQQYLRSQLRLHNCAIFGVTSACYSRTDLPDRYVICPSCHTDHLTLIIRACLAILYAAGQVVLALRRAQTGVDDYELEDEKDTKGKGMTLVISYSRL